MDKVIQNVWKSLPLVVFELLKTSHDDYPLSPKTELSQVQHFLMTFVVISLGVIQAFIMKEDKTFPVTLQDREHCPEIGTLRFVYE
ncbi:hypothetical protein CEXT_449391 [Caerostris extrusa]|uniref:Uncharacterized protein n=1 Tax=Caerostris extrusa TaxID=172846 RepID=A0AAV4TAK0_CAEEX|nr:hypothetical protein CEXT_449391 [Caerostris extrusa]